MRFAKRWKKLLILLIVGLFVISAFYLFREYISNYLVHLQLADITVPGKEDRLLVVAPHNDDEVLGAGELIRRTLQNGGRVKVLLMTNGDGFRNAIAYEDKKLNLKPSDYINFGRLRQKESLTALASLGLPEEDVIFLGYPDGGLSHLWENNWNKKNLYFDPYTQMDHSPYQNSLTADAPYCGEIVVGDLKQVIRDFQPTYIACPHPNDGNPDHWATYNFVQYAETVLNYRPHTELLYLVHQGEWPEPEGYRPSLYLVPPAQLIGTGTDWLKLTPTPEEISAKETAINFYRSQVKVRGSFLHSFVRQNELYGIYPAARLYEDAESDLAKLPLKESKVIAAPTNYYYRTQVFHGSAISAVYAGEIPGEGLRIDVDFAAKNRLEAMETLHVNLILFTGSGVNRCELTVRNHLLTVRPLSGELLQDSSAIEMKESENGVTIRIPQEETGPFHRLFLNASTSLGNVLLDQTAWRLLETE